MKILMLLQQGCPRIVGFDLVMASILANRGHEVSFLGCGLALPACDCTDIGSGITFGKSCQDPRPLTVARNVGYNLPMLRRWVTPEMYPTAQEAAGIPYGLADILAYQGDYLYLGEMAFQSWRLYHHAVMPPINEAEWGLPTIRDFLASAILLSWVYPKVLDELQPDVLWTLNGRYTRQRIPCELMLAAGKRYVSYDMDGDRFHFHVNQPATLLRNDEAMRECQITPEEIEAARAGLLADVDKPGSTWEHDHAKGQMLISDPVEIREILDIDERPMVAFFPHVAYDSGVVGREGSFYDLSDLSLALVEWAREHPQYQLVWRVHPVEVDDTVMNEKGQTLTEWVQSEGRDLPPNLTIIPAESLINSHALARMAVVNVTWSGSLAHQLPYEGIPTIVAGWPPSAGYGIGYEAKSIDEFWQLLQDGIDGKLVPVPDCKPMVERYRAVVQERCRIDLSGIFGKGSWNDFIPQWDGGWPALMPGKFPVLDMIATGVETGSGIWWPV